MFWSRFTPLTVALLLLTAVFYGLSPARVDAGSKVDADLWAADTAVDAVGILVQMADHTAVRPLAPTADKLQKTTHMYDALRANAAAAQTDLIAWLTARRIDHRPYRLVNAVYIPQADAKLIETLAQRPDVVHVHANRRIQLDTPTTDPIPLSASSPTAVAWGVDRINAPLLWAADITGTGVVVGGQDTGYLWTHVALQDQYRGWDGGTADHDYNWHDAIDSDLSGNGSNPCGFSLVAPCEDYDHGSHTMGTMVGADGSNQIGVAPGAEWIACRNMEQGYGTINTYIECFEWFLAPYPYGGDPAQDGDPSKAPHVVNNSWYCPTSEGCNSTNYGLMQTAVDNLRSAGIVVVVSAGNSGSACSSVSAPAAMYDSSFTVGNTTSNDTINFSSSRGPVTVDGSGRMKPDISAPGTGIYSAVRSGGYGSKSGTSMAGPHVAGAVALLISADPTLAGQVDRIEWLLNNGALGITTSQGCGGDSSTAIPNNVYGHGRLDVYAAYQLHLQPAVTTTAAADLLTMTFPAHIPQVEVWHDSHAYTTPTAGSGCLSPTCTVWTGGWLTQTLPVSTTFYYLRGVDNGIMSAFVDGPGIIPQPITPGD